MGGTASKIGDGIGNALGGAVNKIGDVAGGLVGVDIPDIPTQAVQEQRREEQRQAEAQRKEEEKAKADDAKRKQDAYNQANSYQTLPLTIPDIKPIGNLQSVPTPPLVIPKGRVISREEANKAIQQRTAEVQRVLRTREEEEAQKLMLMAGAGGVLLLVLVAAR